MVFYLNRQKVTINGRRVWVPAHIGLHYSLLSNNHYEPELLNFLDRRLKKGSVFIDIGANAGFLGMEAANRVGEKGLVYAFEPNPYIFASLAQVFSHNSHYRNYILNQLAVADKRETVSFFISGSTQSLMERSGFRPENENRIEVRAMAMDLDTYLGTSIVPHLIKIDVEGAEVEVLQGMKRIMQTFKPAVLIEIHGNYFEKPAGHVESIFDYFTEYNYVPYNVLKSSRETLDGFLTDTGTTAVDPTSGRELRYLGYGHMLFEPAAVE